MRVIEEEIQYDEEYQSEWKDHIKKIDREKLQ